MSTGVAFRVVVRALGVLLAGLSSLGCFGALDANLPSPALPVSSTTVPTIQLPGGGELSSRPSSPFTVRDLITMAYQDSDCPDCNGEQAEHVAHDGTDGGYCATIGAIKAAIAVFGLTGVFDRIAVTADGSWTATLRDGKSLSLTSTEQTFAFNGDGKHGIVPGRCGNRGCSAATDRTSDALLLRNWITLYFAFAAKNLQTSVAPQSCQQGPEGYRRAVEAIRNGFTNQRSFSLVGVEQYTVDDPDIASTFGILSVPGHVMFYGQGAVDRWGWPKQLRVFAVVSAVGLSPDVQCNPSAGGLSASDWDPFKVEKQDTSQCPAN